MVWDQSTFALIEKNVSPSIRLGNGSTVQAVRRGDFLRSGSDKKGHTSFKKELMLLNVLYVPRLRSNLITRVALCSGCQTVRFGRGGWSVMKDGVIILESFRDIGMYKTAAQFTNMHSPMSYANRVSSLSERVWHYGLGHANRERIKKLETTRSVVGLHAHR